MSRAPRLLLYGDVDLNIIDGSAIWLASLVELLATQCGTAVTVQLKAPERRDLLTGPLRALPGVTLVAPSTGRLRPSEAVKALCDLDQSVNYDAVVLRGFQISFAAAQSGQLHGRLWTYLTDIPQRAEDVTSEFRAQVTAIAAASELQLCQTEELRDYLEGLLPRSERRTALLTPMVPTIFTPRQHDSVAPQPARRVLYAGKFAPMWGVIELGRAVAALRAEVPDLELHIAGDKVHDPADDPTFAPAVRRLLDSGPGVVWHGGVPRARIATLLHKVDLATSVRDPRMDDSLELSTKVLEYGAAGVPVILNRTAMHERLLGKDYPLFVAGPDELEIVLRLAARNASVVVEAREAVGRAAESYRAEKVAARLAPYLRRLAPSNLSLTRRKRVIIAGHDLKFIAPYVSWLQHSGAEVRLDHWSGHEQHDESKSRELLDWADTILAEWCLGNAVWYARHRRSGQRLVVRMHRQELETPYPAQLTPGSVDRVIAISDRVAGTAVERFGWEAGLVRTIPNAVDVLAFDRPKMPHASHTLGVLGILPRLKRLDRALDLLELLLLEDPRWRLRVGGELPFERPWVWSRLEERAWFARQLDRVRRSPRLRRAVSFDGAVHAPTWFRSIGVILSPSDLESFHLALAEGMASRSVPAIWQREGVAELFDARWLHADTASVAASIASSEDTDGVMARQEIADRYDLDDIGPRLVEEVFG